MLESLEHIVNRPFYIYNYLRFRLKDLGSLLKVASFVTKLDIFHPFRDVNIYCIILDLHCTGTCRTSSEIRRHLGYVIWQRPPPFPSSHRPPRAFFFFFWWGYPAEASAEERGRKDTPFHDVCSEDIKCFFSDGKKIKKNEPARTPLDKRSLDKLIGKHNFPL